VEVTTEGVPDTAGTAIGVSDLRALADAARWALILADFDAKLPVQEHVGFQGFRRRMRRPQDRHRSAT